MENKFNSFIKKLKKFGYKVEPKEGKHIDPVCGMEATSDFFKLEYGEKTYYFCSEYCQQKFNLNPAEYIKDYKI